LSSPKKSMLQRLLEVKGTAYTPEQLRRLNHLTDEATVAVLFNLLGGQPLDIVLREAAENRLEPAAREVLDMVDKAGFVSSYEVKRDFGVQPSTASNRVAYLVRSGLIRFAFDYVPRGGGRRAYYCRTERPEDPQAVKQFIERLAAGAG
jgi:hypothetical protein